MRNRRTLWWSFAICLLVACKPSPEDAPPAAEEEPEGLTEVERVALMEGHYTTAISAHDALIRGDLDAVRYHLLRLEGQVLPRQAPDSWGPFNQRMREAAGGISGVSEIEGAAPVMAGVVEACGVCHMTVELGDVYRRPLFPEGSGLEVAMRGHQWASERLWEGVTGPWDYSWNLGAQELLETDVFQRAADQRSDSLVEQEALVRGIAQSALDTADLHERAEIYGRLLTTCAACHRQVGVTFDVDPSGSAPVDRPR